MTKNAETTGASLEDIPKYIHAISCGLKICERRQNFKGDLTKFCEIFFKGQI